jgi:hypothetical protein
MNNIDYSYFESLKGEFEAEGLGRDDLAAESLFAARHNLDYLVKIGGCEAKADVNYLAALGITSIVAPMIETAFAMEKYMEILPANRFKHVSVTIETITAVGNIEDIINAGTKLSEVTIGRTDLTASFKGSGVESAETMEMVRGVAKTAKKRGLKVTMGGSINKATRLLLAGDKELQDLIDYVETRKVVMPINKFLEELVNKIKEYFPNDDLSEVKELLNNFNIQLDNYKN